MRTFLLSAAVFLSLGVCLADDLKLEFRRAQDEAGPGFTKRQIEGGKESVYVHDTADFALTPNDVEEAKPGLTGGFQPAVIITFTRSGGEKMSQLTADWLGKKLAIVVNGKVIAAPVIRSRITDSAIIEGNFTAAEVERIARSLQKE